MSLNQTKLYISIIYVSIIFSIKLLVRNAVGIFCSSSQIDWPEKRVYSIILRCTSNILSEESGEIVGLILQDSLVFETALLRILEVKWACSRVRGFFSFLFFSFFFYCIVFLFFFFFPPRQIYFVCFLNISIDQHKNRKDTFVMLNNRCELSYRTRSVQLRA